MFLTVVKGKEYLLKNKGPLKLLFIETLANGKYDFQALIIKERVIIHFSSIMKY